MGLEGFRWTRQVCPDFFFSNAIANYRMTSLSRFCFLERDDELPNYKFVQILISRTRLRPAGALNSKKGPNCDVPRLQTVPARLLTIDFRFHCHYFYFCKLYPQTQKHIGNAMVMCFYYYLFRWNHPNNSVVLQMSSLSTHNMRCNCRDTSKLLFAYFCYFLGGEIRPKHETPPPQSWLLPQTHTYISSWANSCYTPSWNAWVVFSNATEGNQRNIKPIL